MDLEDINDVDDNDTEMEELSIEDIEDLSLEELSDIDADGILEKGDSLLDVSRQEQIDMLTEYKEQLFDYQGSMQRRHDIEELYALKDELLDLRDVEDDSDDEQKVLKMR